MMKERPVKKIAYAHRGDKPVVDWLLEFIENRYQIEIVDPQDADYVFHTALGYDAVNYSGVRIYFTGENLSPDFRISDYAMGFDYLQFGDRYKRLPLIRLYREAYQTFLNPRPDPAKIASGKTDFCAYVMSNTKNSADARTEIFDLLSAYKQVNSGGKWRNNVGGPVADKLAFQSSHKFVLAFENSSTPGYLTEKFADAAQANAVPIYWGDPTIADTFNPEAFINCHDFDSFEAVVEEVKRIDQDDNRYYAMLAAPWFPDNREPEYLSEASIVSFLSHIFDQSLQDAYRRNRSRWGKKAEQALARAFFNPVLQCGIRAKESLREIRDR